MIAMPTDQQVFQIFQAQSSWTARGIDSVIPIELESFRIASG